MKINDELKKRIRNLACRRQRSSQRWMQEASEQYVTREQQRESVEEDALAAWRQSEPSNLLNLSR